MALHEAHTVNGIVLGLPAGNPSFTVFRGIPYAAPPIGNNRWRAPQPVKSWDGIRKAYEFSSFCPQKIINDDPLFARQNPIPFQGQSEDCLYLNVWTPAETAEERLPVLVWIHGGANVTGYGNEIYYDGEQFAKRGVILVTFNWRVNIFGWLVHPELDEENDQQTSGNYGTLDQVAALRWVRDNISAFGGDPNNITIGGESAGASSVFSLLFTPLASGLFQHAVMHSGGGLDIFTTPTFLSHRDAIELTDLHKLLGVDSIAEARCIDALDIENRLNTSDSTDGYVPLQNVDGWCFPDKLESMARRGEFAHVPMIMGYNSDETGMYNYPIDQRKFIREAQNEYGVYAKGYLALCDFLADDSALAHHLATRNAELLKTAAVNWADTVEEKSKEPLFMFCFDRKMPGDDAGAFHSAELWYLFGSLQRSWRPFAGSDFMLAELFADYWCNFAKSGDPNGSGFSGNSLPQWKRYSQAVPETMELGLEQGMRDFGVNKRILYRQSFVNGTLPGQRCPGDRG